jgi:ABC-type Mn2+/Zn2+ transport system permease subunit
MSEVLTSFTLPFMQMALAAGLLVGCTCAYLGVSLVLKRIVFVGAALAEIAAAGLALGLLLGGTFDLHEVLPHTAVHFPEVVSFAMTLLGIVFFWVPWAERRISRESLIGYAYAAATAIAVLLVARNPGGEMHDLDLLSGNLLFVNSHDLVAIGTCSVIVCALHVLFRKEFLFVSFDPDMARTLGLRSRLYDFLVYLTIGATIAVAMRVVGVLFVFSSLIIPALAGLVLGRRMPAVMTISILTAVIGVTAGLAISFHQDLPTGPTVVVCYAVLLLVAAGIAKVLRR